MNKLPLEIWEHIVERTIWATQPFDPKKERWEDSPLKLELATFHPLPHYLGHGGYKSKSTCAEKSLVSLMRTSKEFKRICDRFTRELLSARATLEHRCECDSQPYDASQESYHDCDNLVHHWGCTIEGGEASMHTKVLNLVDHSGWEERYYFGWVEPEAAQLEPLRACTGLANLSLDGQTFAWLLPILDALPGKGATLKQLKASYPEVPEDAPDAKIEHIIKAISRCTQLDVLDLHHAWQGERPYRSKATVFALRAVAVLPRLSYLRLSVFADDELRFSLGGKTATQVARALQVPITRLSIAHSHIELDVIQGIIEACHETLEYVNLDNNYDFNTNSVPESPVTATFPQLRYVAVRGWSVDFVEDETDLGPSILPAHWRLPALEHLEAEEVDVGGQEGIDTFTARLLSWTTLRYLRIEGRWTDEGWGPSISEEDEDPRYLWPSRLKADLRARGVETHLYVFVRGE